MVFVIVVGHLWILRWFRYPIYGWFMTQSYNIICNAMFLWYLCCISWICINNTRIAVRRSWHIFNNRDHNAWSYRSDRLLSHFLYFDWYGIYLKIFSIIFFSLFKSFGFYILLGWVFLIFCLSFDSHWERCFVDDDFLTHQIAPYEFLRFHQYLFVT